ncbi:uncharacterized mitochondrial protein-like protein [Tanacetum coccineum]
MEESLIKFMFESVKIHDENSNLIKEIRSSTDAAIRNQGASIKALEIQIGKMSKVLQERGPGSLPGSTETNTRDHVKSISTTIEDDTPSIRGELMDRKESATNLKRILLEKPRIGYQIKASMNMHDSAIREDSLPLKEKNLGSFTIPCYINNICFKKALADLGASLNVIPYSTFTNLGLGEMTPTKPIIELADRKIKCPKGIAENVLVGIDKFVFPVDFIVLDMPEDIKVPLILGRPFLSTTHAKIDVFKSKITLRVTNDKIVFKSDNFTSNIIRRVYMLGLRERMELDLEVRLMGEALILNRSLDPVYGDYIKLNDINKPLELRRNQVEDLGPTIEEGEVIDEPLEDIVKTRSDDREIEGINEYHSFYDFDRKIHIDCAYNLQFSCVIGFGHVNANFFPILSINVMSRKFYNSIMKDKVEYRGKNIVRAFINVPIFVGNFFVVTDFTVVENMDAYRDQDRGEVIVGRPFCRASYVEARWFDGMITIYNGNDSVTYQMAHSHPRFKHLTNKQCNMMRPILKVSTRDELNGISHPYQKLKSFYKRVLNLGPEYIRNTVIIEQRVKVNHKARILELKQRNHEVYCSDILCAISNKEDTAYPCPRLHSPSTKESSIRRI